MPDRMKKFCLIAALLVASVAPVSAQVDRATVTGTLRDTSGATVPDADITIQYPSTGLTRTAVSNHSGHFLLNGLPVGHVVIDITKQGFENVHTETDLDVGQTDTLDLALQPASVNTTVEVIADNDLNKNSVATAGVLNNEQIQSLPINGRNWGGLMTLTPGAVDTGAGNGASVRFLGHGGDDNNFRIDGVDATSVRNQAESKSRLMLSEDAIAEFKVNTQMYTAETGGATGGQIEIATKTGTNDFHGSLFEYLRNSALDSRSPFDTRIPPFHMNQFGATAGGAIQRDKTFFFLSYEQLIQNQGITQIGFVPSDAARAQAVPAVKGLIDLYPEGQRPVTGIPNVMQWTGVGQATQNENVGLLRIDHRFTDKLSAYVRYNQNATDIFTPNSSLPYGTRNLDAPKSGLFDFLYLISPSSTNELRLGANYAQPLNSIPSGAEATISIPNLSTMPGGNRRLAVGMSQSLVDNWTTLRGAHTIKAGVEIRRVQLIVHDFNLSDGTASFASFNDFLNDKLNTVAGSGELPSKQMRKIEYFGYVQDEWKVKPNFTANIGLRYEFFNAFTERNGRDVPFDVQTCGGYCQRGSDFAFPPMLNLAPRLGLAWSPDAFHGRTVIRAGAGIFFGDAQLGDQYSPANNDASRYTLSSATTPGLAYPFDAFINPNSALAAAPRSMPRNHKNETSQQWTLGIQQELSKHVTFQISYDGQQNYHVFSRTYVNLINPVTGQRPFPSLDQIDVRGEDGVASFHGLLSSIQFRDWHGWLFGANYMLAHAINDGSSGGGASDGAPQSVACRSCEKGNSDYDARHVFNANFSYAIPIGHNHWYGGWQWSGLATAHTGLPISVTVSRKANTVPDGNVLSSERPNLVAGVPLYLDYASTGLWLNPAAFAVPAPGTWGNLGRNVLRAPGLFQIDTSLVKQTRIFERGSFQIGVEAFNILNHPQLGTPGTNISSTSNFGRITSLINTSPVGAGTPRQIQLMARFEF
jgi:opacity protein-like surface antigen